MLRQPAVLSMTTKILTGLNNSQLKAVQHVDGPLLILAGPGSGKTRVITHRIAYLVHAHGIDPSRIAAVTFTNKAAGEMRQRLTDLLGPSSGGLTAATFHSFCARILRDYGHHINLQRDFTIYDDADQRKSLIQAMNDVGIDPKSRDPSTIQSAISHAKSRLVDSFGFAATQQNHRDKLIHRVFDRYDYLLARANAVDFDDLLLKTYQLLSKFPDVASSYQQRFQHLLIDEFQDTNHAQYEIARQLAAVNNNLCVVGDPDQAIYSWRSADIQNILNFISDFPDAAEITLDQSYRSSKTILATAQTVIKANSQRIQRDIWTDNDQGLPIDLRKTYDHDDEADEVLQEIEALICTGDYRPKDIAVMFRINAQHHPLEKACLQHHMPYHLVGGIRFYEREEIKDVTAYLRLLANPNDDVSLARVINVPKRGIGGTTLDTLSRMANDAGTSIWCQLEKLTDNAADQPAPRASIKPRQLNALVKFHEMMLSMAKQAESLDLAGKIDLLFDTTNYPNYAVELKRGPERLHNLDELRSQVADFASSSHQQASTDLSPLTLFLEHTSLMSQVDDLQDDSDAVTLITLHQAKGLEFPVVFIVGVEDGLLPHQKSIDDDDKLEEERRLFYVGLTRAEKRLYLTHASERALHGTFGPRKPSRFLDDLPDDLLVVNLP